MTRRKRRNAGFTLVELLVVIGIIALLISILLPSLNKARRQAKNIQCLSNLRSIGQMVQIYSSQHKNALLPTIIWGAGNRDDSWAILLVSLGLVDSPNLARGSEGGGRGILMCPEATEVLITTNIPGLTGAGNAAFDGYERRESYHLQPGLIVDYGYGINGATYRRSEQPDPNHVHYKAASSSISYDPAVPCVPMRKVTDFTRSSDTVLLFDGIAWNPWGTPQRVSGGRHGNFDRAKPYDTGMTNLLLMDGHAESAQRAELPMNGTQFTGTSAQLRSPRFLWNLSQR